jgi:hypothetical protein
MTVLVRNFAGPSTGTTVTDARVYLDTITLLSRGSLPKLVLKTVRRLQGKALHIEKAEIIGRNGLPLGHWYYSSIHQPTIATLNYLARMKGEKVFLYAVHVAFDFMGAGRAAALSTKEFLIQSLLLKWRPIEDLPPPEPNTDYWRYDRKASRNVALYSDRPSKTGRGYCCHLEFRVTGTAACRRAGLADLKELARGTIDPFSILERQAKLAPVDPTRLDSAIVRMARKRLRTGRHHPGPTSRHHPGLTVAALNIKLRRLLARSFGTAPLTEATLHLVRSQDLWDNRKRKSLRKALVEIPWQRFTPRPQWHHWA